MPDNSVTREIFGNIDDLSKMIFYVLAIASLACFAYGVYRRARLWRLGRQSGRGVVWRNVVPRFFRKILFHKMLRRGRPSAGLAHLLLFGGIATLFVGSLLVAIEHYTAPFVGRNTTDPLFHKGIYFALFEAILDTAGLAMLVGCAWFIGRRLGRKSSIAHSSLDLVVLTTIVMLGLTGYFAEGLRIILEQTPQPGFSYAGLMMASLFVSAGVTRDGAVMLHFSLWWFHTVLAFGFIAAFPYTRLLHAIAGAINLVIRDEQLGTLVPVTLEELEETGKVGAEKIEDFSRRQLLEMDACVSCGRCQDACPAYDAGRPLSPRDLVQDLRSFLNCADGKRAEESNAPTRLGESISTDTLWSCTTCHACVDICPLGVSPLGMLVDLRRNVVAEGYLRGAPATALQKMQRSGNPWGLPAVDRMAWAKGLHVQTVQENPDFEVLYWVGCAAAYDRRIQKVARAVVQLFQEAGVDFAVLGREERCTGESARRMGDEFLFQELASTNLENLARHKVRKIVTHCPHCLNSLKKDYPQFGGVFEVFHHTQFLAELVAKGKLKTNSTPQNGSKTITYHDPCYLARVNDVRESPRELIQLPLPDSETNVELPRSGCDTACCGAGGGRMWFDDSVDARIGGSRVEEIVQSGAEKVVTACPFCLTMLRDGLATSDSKIEVLDISELLAEALGSHG